MTRSLQHYCVRVTAFSQTDLFLDWILGEWDSHRSPITNYNKLSWRHRVTEPELPLFFSGKDSLKIDRSVKMPLHRPSMGAVGSGSWVPATTTSSTHLDSLRIGVSLLHLVNLLSLTVLPGPIPYAFHVIIQSSPYSTFDTRSRHKTRHW